jgi:hypothetical protein
VIFFVDVTGNGFVKISPDPEDGICYYLEYKKSPHPVTFIGKGKKLKL